MKDLNPRLMPRDKRRWWWVVSLACRDSVVEMRRVTVGEACRPCGHHGPRGIEGTRPGRVSCVRNVTIPSRSGPGVGSWAGGLTVREAEFPGGQG